MIDAYVTEVLTTVPPTSTTRPGRPGPAARTLNGPSAGSAASGGLPDSLIEARGKMAHPPARAIEDRQPH
jgi:hypothetical protein